MTTKNVFISQNMKDRTKNEILEERQTILKEFYNENNDISVIDSYMENYDEMTSNCKHPRIKGISYALECLAEADILITPYNGDVVNCDDVYRNPGVFIEYNSFIHQHDGNVQIYYYYRMNDGKMKFISILE